MVSFTYGRETVIYLDPLHMTAEVYCAPVKSGLEKQLVKESGESLQKFCRKCHDIIYGILLQFNNLLFYDRSHLV